MKLTSHDLDFFINFDFLNIRLKCSENDLLEIDSLIKNLIKFEIKTRDLDFFVNHYYLTKIVYFLIILSKSTFSRDDILFFLLILAKIQDFEQN